MATNDPFGDFRRGRSSLFDEFLSEFFDRPFGIEGATGRTGARTSAPLARRPVEQVDITQFFSERYAVRSRAPVRRHSRP
jgi:hypothetical protein